MRRNGRGKKGESIVLNVLYSFQYGTASMYGVQLYISQFGQNVHVVGSSKSLGCWNPAKSVPLKWSPGHVWSGCIVASSDGEVVCHDTQEQKE